MIIAIPRAIARWGYPWAQGFFGRNDTSPLTLMITSNGETATPPIHISDDLKQRADRIKETFLRVVLFGAPDDVSIEARLNGTRLQVLTRDTGWKDPQIFSPRPQPASGGKGDYRINPRQRLLRLDFTVDPQMCLVGKNVAGLRLKNLGKGIAATEVQLEKLELFVRYERRE